jgi:hypothetical protein
LEKNTRLGLEAAPPGPALTCVPNAVATSRFDALRARCRARGGRGDGDRAGARHRDVGGAVDGGQHRAARPRRPVPALQSVEAVGGVDVLVGGVAEARERPRPAEQATGGAQHHAARVDRLQPRAAPGDELAAAGGGVVGRHRVDALRQVRRGQVDVAVALADRAALGEVDVEQVDGFLVADGV